MGRRFLYLLVGVDLCQLAAACQMNHVIVASKASIHERERSSPLLCGVVIVSDAFDHHALPVGQQQPRATARPTLSPLSPRSPPYATSASLVNALPLHTYVRSRMCSVSCYCPALVFPCGRFASRPGPRAVRGRLGNTPLGSIFSLGGRAPFVLPPHCALCPALLVFCASRLTGALTPFVGPPTAHCFSPVLVVPHRPSCRGLRPPMR